MVWYFAVVIIFRISRVSPDPGVGWVICYCSTFSYFARAYPFNLKMRPGANEWMRPDMPIQGEETRRRIIRGAYVGREFGDGDDDCLSWICARRSGFSRAVGFRATWVGFLRCVNLWGLGRMKSH